LAPVLDVKELGNDLTARHQLLFVTDATLDRAKAPGKTIQPALSI